jgi:hypothetical protein
MKCTWPNTFELEKRLTFLIAHSGEIPFKHFKLLKFIADVLFPSGKQHAYTQNKSAIFKNKDGKACVVIFAYQTGIFELR